MSVPSGRWERRELGVAVPPATAGSHLSILQGVPNAAGRVLVEVCFWKAPTPLAGLSVGPALMGYCSSLWLQVK